MFTSEYFMNILERVNKEYIDELVKNNPVPSFRAGDTVQVAIKIKEGDKTRTQLFEGVVIARKNRSIGSSFKVRKISNGEGVERLFHLYSPNISIKVLKHGKVRRAKLYYLRNKKGKATRIVEKTRKNDVNE